VRFFEFLESIKKYLFKKHEKTINNIINSAEIKPGIFAFFAVSKKSNKIRRDSFRILPFLLSFPKAGQL